MKTFDDFKNEVSSEKITLAVLEAAKRLIAFTVHSGDVFKLTGFDIGVITTIKQSGQTLDPVDSLESVVEGTYFNDRENKILYLQTLDSSNPNSKFIHITFKLFFANQPVTLPYNLDDGFEVYWEPSISSTSDFGVEIDTVNQQNETIEGAGSLTLFNDQEFWIQNYEKLYFENQSCVIYSWNRELAANQAKKLFTGKVESKKFGTDKIVFNLKDLMSALRNTVSLSEIQALGLRNPHNLDKAKQRMVYGRVFGHRLTNLDAVIDDLYPLTGKISVSFNSNVVTGLATKFLTQVNPDDQLDINGTQYTIGAVTSDNSLLLTEAFGAADVIEIAVSIRPANPKRWNNRVWSIAGHALREPVTATQVGSSTSQLFVESTADMFDGDFIYVGPLGAGELVTIEKVVNSNRITLSTSLASNPGAGTQVLRPCVQQVMIDDVKLVYYRDYTVNAETGILTLRDTAEVLAGPTRDSLASGFFVNGSREVYSGQRATGTLSYTTPVVLGSSYIDVARNSTTFKTVINSSSANPNDQVLAAFSGSNAAIVLTITPNDGTNYTKKPEAILNLTTDITLTSKQPGTSRNGYTFQIQVAPAAANPQDKVLISFTGTVSAIVMTVTPNNGTNNSGNAVSLSTEDVVSLINNGYVIDKSITVTDPNNFLQEQTASGGDSTLLADGGEGDGITGTYTGGINAGTTAINLTTSNLVELINTGKVTGKNVVVSDLSTLRELQTATGGDNTNVVHGGQGDNVTATFSGGSSIGKASYKTTFMSGNVIRPYGTADFYEILSVDSDSRLLLRTPFLGVTTSQVPIQYKSLVFDPAENILHCEVIGRTATGTTDGRLLRKGPEIVAQLLGDAGFIMDEVNYGSFNDAQQRVPEDLSFVIPQKFDDTSNVTYRDVVNRVNKSIFGVLFQDNNFQMSYDILRPNIPSSPLVIRESDTLKFGVESTNKNMVNKAIVQYGFLEYDTRARAASIASVEKVSDLATYVLNTSREKTFDSVLLNEADAQRLCNRWGFLLERATNSVTIQTKLQAIDCEINDIVDFDHRKFYIRSSGNSSRKFLSIERVNKNGFGVLIECVDLSNAFNRIAMITDTESSWVNASEDIRIKAGFITDEYGLINNEENSFGSNLIW